MNDTNSLREIEDEYENKLAKMCEGAVEAVMATELGTLRIDVMDANMHDLDVVDELLGVDSVERHPRGYLKITTEEQVTSCSVIR